MPPAASLAHGPIWSTITRFGESSVLLPLAAALIVSVALISRRTQPALNWTLPIGVAVLVTAASKVAFLGFGLGIEGLDFTGFSGHAMIAAAVYPMLARLLTTPASDAVRKTALLIAYAAALGVMVSRIVVGAHSTSEAIAGFVLGALASALALHRSTDTPRVTFAAGAALAAICGWAMTPQAPRPIHTHDLITQAALKLSNRSRPFTRADLHRHPTATPARSAAVRMTAPPA